MYEVFQLMFYPWDTALGAWPWQGSSRGCFFFIQQNENEVMDFPGIELFIEFKFLCTMF